MYSDVMALRPPSPSRERPTSPSESPVMGPDSTRVPHCPYDERRAVDNGNHTGNTELCLINNSKSSEREDSPWTTVKRRCAHGQGSSKNKKPFTSEQAQMVNKAAEGMTASGNFKIYLNLLSFNLPHLLPNK